MTKTNERLKEQYSVRFILLKVRYGDREMNQPGTVTVLGSYGKCHIVRVPW